MEDIEETCLRPHLLILRFHRLWPKQDSKLITFKDFLITNLYYPVVIYFFLANLHLYKTYTDPTSDISLDILEISQLAFDIYVFFVYFLKVNEIVPFVTDLKCYTKFGRPKNLTELITTQNRNMKILYTYIVFGALVYGGYSYYSTEQCEKKNTEDGTANLCPLLIPLWLPRSLMAKYAVRLVIFIIQTIFLLCWLPPAVTAAYAIACINELLTARVAHLNGLLEEASMVSSVREKQQKLMHIFKYHIDILRLVERCESSFGILNSVHFLISSVVLGLLYYRILSFHLLMDILQLNGWLICMFGLCYSGQLLINESEILAKKMYAFDWVDLEPGFKRCVLMMMLRSQTPMKIRAGIFYSFSNEFMMRIAQASYTYVAVISRIFTK